jgi:DNA-binding PadR family transcriptional regulator
VNATEYLILRAISETPCHAYEIRKRIIRQTDGIVRIPKTTLHEALKRMVDKGLVRQLGTVVVNGRTRHLYTADVTQ